MIAALKKILLGKEDSPPQQVSASRLRPFVESSSMSLEQTSDSEVDLRHQPSSLQGISKPFLDQSLDVQSHHVFRQSPSTSWLSLGAKKQSRKGHLNFNSSKENKVPVSSLRSLAVSKTNQLDFKTQLQPELVQPNAVRTTAALEPADFQVVPVETANLSSDQFETTQMNDNDRHSVDFSLESNHSQALNSIHDLPPPAEVDAQPDDLSVPNLESSSLVFTPAQPSTLNQDDSPTESFGPIKVYLEQAEIYSREKNWDKAIAACQEALTVQPETAAAYKLWGNILQKMGQTTDAMGYYAKALVIQPEFPEVYANLGSLYANQAQWEEAASYYQKAIELNPRFVGAYRNLAKIWQKLDQPEKQTQCLVCALTLEPGRGTAGEYYQLGNRLLDYGHVDQAIKFFRASIELDPNYLVACNKLAEALEQQGDWKSAVTYYRQVLDIRTEKVEEQSSASLTEDSPIKSPSLESPKTPKIGQKEIIVQKLRHPVPNDTQPVSMSNSPLLIQTKKLLKAEIEQPDSDLIKVALGDIYTQQKSWTQAIDAYKAALRLNPKLANVYLKLAQVFSHTGKISESAEAYHRAFMLDDKLGSVEKYLKLGRTFLKLEKFERAIAHYENALRLDPRAVKIYQELANIFQKLGKRHEAIELLYRLVMLKAEWATPARCVKVADTLLENNQQQKAIDCYKQALRLDPKLTAARTKLKSILGSHFESQRTQVDPIYTESINQAMDAHRQGEYFSAQKKWTDAVNAYKRAIKLNPKFSWSYHNLGKALFEQGSWEEAVEAQKKSISINPDFFWSYAALGDAFNRLQKWDEAARAYQKALDIDPNCHQVICQLAEVLKRSGQASLDKASALYMKGSQAEDSEESIYREALALNPHAIDIYFKLARVLARQNRLDEVIFTYQTARQFEPSNLEILSELSKTLCRKEEWDNAADCLRDALSFEPDNANLHFALSEVWIQAGKLDEALQSLQRSIQLNPAESWSYQTLGNVYMWMNKHKSAIAAYQKAIELNPNFAAAYKQMGDALTALGKGTDGSEAYRKALELDPYVLQTEPMEQI